MLNKILQTSKKSTSLKKHGCAETKLSTHHKTCTVRCFIDKCEFLTCLYRPAYNKINCIDNAILKPDFLPLLREHFLATVLQDQHKTTQSSSLDDLLCIVLREHFLATVIQDQHKGGTDTSEGVCNEALVDTCSDALLCCNLLETINCSVVDVLLLWQLSLHLEAATDGIEWVTDAGTSNDRRLSGKEGGDEAEDTLVILVWVQSTKCVECTELEATVWDDSHKRDTETSIETCRAQWASSCLLQAVNQAIEGLLAAADIRCETGTCIVQRVDDAQASSCSHTTGGHVDCKEHAELFLWAVLGEHVLEGILERQVEGLSWEVTDAIGGIPSPECANTLLGCDAAEAINNARVPFDFTTADQWVGILGLNEELHTLNGCSECLGDCTGHTTKAEVRGPGLEGKLLFCHDVTG